MSDYELEQKIDGELRSQIDRALSMNCTPDHLLRNIRKNGESEETIKACEEYMAKWKENEKWIH